MSNNKHDFEEDLKAALGDDMKKDTQLCKNVWSALANVIWVHKDGKEYSCTFRCAGGVVARILGEGDYLDWYCCAGYAVVTDKIAEEMKKLGWTHKFYEDTQEN